MVSSYCHCGSNSIISYVPETPIIDVINHVGNWRQIAFLEVKLEEEFPFSNVESHDDYLVVLLVSVNVIDKKFEFLMCANGVLKEHELLRAVIPVDKILSDIHKFLCDLVS